MKEGDIQRQENATSTMVRQVANLLRRHSPINVFQFIINPASFCQTIENIFYLSFSLRDARARIKHNRNGIPIVTYIENLNDEEMEIENKQSIMDMTLRHYEVPSLSNTYTTLFWEKLT